MINMARINKIKRDEDEFYKNHPELERDLNIYGIKIVQDITLEDKAIHTVKSFHNMVMIPIETNNNSDNKYFKLYEDTSCCAIPIEQRQISTLDMAIRMYDKFTHSLFTLVDDSMDINRKYTKDDQLTMNRNVMVNNKFIEEIVLSRSIMVSAIKSLNRLGPYDIDLSTDDGIDEVNIIYAFNGFMCLYLFCSDVKGYKDTPIGEEIDTLDRVICRTNSFVFPPKHIDKYYYRYM